MAFSRLLFVAAVVGVLAAPSWAAPVSSCPAPCSKPPKAALFMAEPSGALDATGNIATLMGTIAKGVKKTVLRLDATVDVYANPAIEGCFVTARVNEVFFSMGQSNTMDTPVNSDCTITGTYWIDIDQAEASHPGQFIGQPLVVIVDGGSQASGGMGDPYVASVSVQVIKNK